MAAAPKKKASAKGKAKAAKVKVRGVTPFLWFEKDAGDAARFYVSLIAGSKVQRADDFAAEFTLAGQPFYALNGGPVYKHTPAFSMFVEVDTQAQVDALWESLLADGGKPDRCGWLTDKYGLSWQVIPKRLTQLLAHKDPATAERAMKAMLKMRKIDIGALDAAVKGA